MAGRWSARWGAAAVVGLLVAATGTPAAAAAGGPVGWPSYGNDLANTRYQNLDGIGTANAAKLKPLWVFHTGALDKKSSFEASPLVVGDTMYVSTGHDDVFALDAATGAQKWVYHALPDMPPIKELSVCCGKDNRGVAYGNGMIYLSRLDGVLVALDARTGAVRWRQVVADWRHGYAITMAPQSPTASS